MSLSLNKLWDKTFSLKYMYYKCVGPLTGTPMWNMLGILRKMAASTSCGLLVAPITMTWQFGSVNSPSQKLINCVLIIAVASWSVDVRDLRKESENQDYFYKNESATKMFNDYAST